MTAPLRETPPADTPLAPKFSPAWLLVGLVLVALNLRPALSSLAPLLGQVTTELGLSGASAGLLTTLPVLCLGLFAPLAPGLARRFGAERVVLVVLCCLGLGILLRTLAGPLGLFAGSLVSGASIGVIGVLLPGIVKRDFPQHAGTLTGVYTMALCMGAALAAGASVPLAHASGGSWRFGLGFWVVPVVVAALAWWPHTRRHGQAHRGRFQVRGLLRDRLAWQVTLYMGSQSSLAYIVFGWLPSILVARGLSPEQAGLVTSVSILVQMASSLTAPWLATRGRDQRLAVVVVMCLTLAGLFGCLYAPLGGLWGWAVLLGLGQGAMFAVALSLIVLRASDAHVASALSGMAQGVGYTLASLGPLLVGVIHDWTGGWSAVGWLFAVIGVLAIGFGLGAGRALHVQVRSEAVGA
ncbi:MULTISPECIES: MFS transporter [unclassified Pseudomonas]|uniref:CynX/NimT family MFS transporter n=1 Tax=unclassified Pseudomonas TaxID=196821 RepID=UPI000BCD0814|nr:MULTISPECIES: CynX/NimT family MFS transporter [unclassified Pseudomonas]PVZ11257.1 CP family cyanate transporter-like MFS transporter [Pseudomonas sp. URIL14HWK12:I12]PVZ22255.1 CP family cyanate transporter-like MFS transporter [Pseudomonas sp. URIL14HWK12:I10]PVZ31621.1 CP family cyanate transporter-like MFS transporter [Pseudomonas sp. URIL14HWK12:I11]SNZ16647.1 MFS transporter, CP family, cyanate transporter [Pseudomonas sp. URIL14HWK12:I9]